MGERALAMSMIARRAVIVESALGAALPAAANSATTSERKSIGQKWIDGWNTTDPKVLVAAFTPDGVL